MDYYARDNGKIPNTQANQAGLEVDSRPPPSAEQQQWISTNGETKYGHDGTGKRKILGLSVGVFWAVVVVLILLLAGGIGGGVGAGLASQKKSCDIASSNNGSSSSGESANNAVCTTTTTRTISLSSTPSPTSSSTSSAGVSPAPISPCTSSPNVNNTNITPISSTGEPFSFSSGGSQTFRILCNTNYPGGSFYGNPDVWDLQMMYLPTIDLCVAACAAYNVGIVRRGGAEAEMCKVVALVIKEGEGCYFKNATGAVNNTDTSGEGVRIDSAVLL